MNDTEMMDWMQEHIISYRHGLSEEQPFVLAYFDDQDETKTITGTSLRDCITKAYAEGTTRLTPL